MKKSVIKTYAIHTFGCRVNQAEMQDISNQLSEMGLCQSEKNPDFYIINTCAVTKKAEREARQLINRIRKKHLRTKIVITGCAATKWQSQTRNNKKQITNKVYREKSIIVIRNKEKKSIISYIQGRALKNLYAQGRALKGGRSKYLRSKRYLVKIQDGCNRFCTYCIVPYLRGKPKSIPIKKIIKIIKSQEKDIQEIILTAINTEYYGVDNGENFVELINEILTKTNISRLSFGSINPWSIDNNFINYYLKIKNQKLKIKNNVEFIDFFHIPLQSGSNRILKLMKRDYTKEEFLKKIKKIAKINPLAFIATDVIVGFLDETEKDFQDTYEFLEKSPISKFHVFRFSPREGTAAYFMRKKYKESSEKIKKERARKLRKLSEQKYSIFLKKHVEKRFSALFLDKKIDGFQQALLTNQIPVLVKTKKQVVGKIKSIKVEKLENNELFGKIA